MEFILIKRDSPEWDYMWNWLAQHPLNEGSENPTEMDNLGEIWEYMGSYKRGNEVFHEMRHRNHPRTSKMETLVLKASDAFTEEQIQVSKKI